MRALNTLGRYLAFGVVPVVALWTVFVPLRRDHWRQFATIAVSVLMASIVAARVFVKEEKTSWTMVSVYSVDRDVACAISQFALVYSSPGEDPEGFVTVPKGTQFMIVGNGGYTWRAWLRLSNDIQEVYVNQEVFESYFTKVGEIELRSLIRIPTDVAAQKWPGRRHRPSLSDPDARRLQKTNRPPFLCPNWWSPEAAQRDRCAIPPWLSLIEISKGLETSSGRT